MLKTVISAEVDVTIMQLDVDTSVVELQPDQHNMDVHDYIGEQDENFDKLVKFYHSSACGHGVQQFLVVHESVLPTSYDQYNCNTLNPYPQPRRCEKKFGKFDINAVDQEYARINKFKQSKATEYGQLYIMTSHLSNVGMHMLEFMLCPTLPPELYKPAALNKQAVW